jgi:DNA-binding CsgD family transcriptional regulator
VGHDGLQIRDVKSLVNAVMEFGSVDSPMGDASQQHLMREAAQLTGAAAVTMLELTGFNPGGVWRASRFDQLNLPHAEDLIHEYLRSANHDDPSEPPFRALPGVHVVATRQQLVEDAEWYRSPHVMDFRRAMRMDHCAYSMIYHDRPGCVSCLCLFREWGDKVPFSPRDTSVLEVLHHSWMKLRPSMSGSVGSPRHEPPLSPRLAEVLSLLQQGLSEKQVSQRLDVSPHTTHAHVVSLYRRFGVSSRAELLARTMGH